MAKKKVRVALRKNRADPPRTNDLTRADADDAADAVSGERVRAKGDLSRRRHVAVDDPAAAPADGTHPGRVLEVHGLNSYVEVADGRVVRCAVKRLLKTVASDARNPVVTGDRVWFRLAEGASGKGPGASPEPSSLAPGPLPLAPSADGLIERVEPRRGVLTRASRRREQVLVANVDQLLIVMSLVEPDLKPHLIDRYVAVAQQGELAPVLCLDKADLADPVALQPLIGAYSRLGIPTVLTSAATGVGVNRLRELLRGRATVFSGQSGVGKSSLLDALQPGLARRVKSVSEANQKGRHATTAAELIRLESGGWVVDTPGVRQLQLYDLRQGEVEGYFREFRPYVALCRFPDCSHTHEAGCAVRGAVARRAISDRRYESYVGLFRGRRE